MTYRSGTVNSKSFVCNVFLLIKWKFELTVHFKDEIKGKHFTEMPQKLWIKWNFELTVFELTLSDLYINWRCHHYWNFSTSSCNQLCRAESKIPVRGAVKLRQYRAVGCAPRPYNNNMRLENLELKKSINIECRYSPIFQLIVLEMALTDDPWLYLRSLFLAVMINLLKMVPLLETFHLQHPSCFLNAVLNWLK